MTDIKIVDGGLLVPMEVADAVTLATLQETVERIRKELADHEKGEWMHPEDVKMNHEMIPALEKVIWYFG